MPPNIKESFVNLMTIKYFKRNCHCQDFVLNFSIWSCFFISSLLWEFPENGILEISWAEALESCLMVAPMMALRPFYPY